MPGPVPKRSQTRQRRNRASTGTTLTASTAQKPELPPQFAHPFTRRWWDTIWASPMVEEWVDADVPGLLVVASLVENFWQTADPKVAAEIRMQSREYGLSPLSRRSLQWEIKRVEAARPMPAPRTQRQRRTLLDILEGGKAG
jgi:hypothetical protein